MLVAVTDHAAARFRQRVGGRSGELDPRGEIVQRVSAAVAAGRTSEEPPPGTSSPRRGSVYVRDLVDRSLVFVCRRDGAELVVVTLWEVERGRAGLPSPRVPRRFTDALRRLGGGEDG